MIQTIGLTLKVALWCTGLGLPISLALGWILARCQFPGKTVLSFIIFAPLVIPPVATGFLLLEVFGRNSALGGLLARLGMPISFSMAGAVLASLVVGLPLYVMTIRAAFEAVDPRYEEMAWTLGLSRVKTFFRVTLPLALPGILAGAVLAFARALGEFGATVVLAGNVEGETRTLALALYSLLDSPNGESESRILLGASLGLSFASLLIYELLLRWHHQRIAGRGSGRFSGRWGGGMGDRRG